MGASITFLAADLLATLRPGKLFSRDLFQPLRTFPADTKPTLDPEIHFEPVHALDGGPDGLDVIRRIAVQARHFLEDQGALIVEMDPEQEAQARRIFTASPDSRTCDLSRPFWKDTCPEGQTPEMRYLIAGFGKFGRIAFERITSNFPDCELIAIEPDIEKTAAITDKCEVIGEDAAAFLSNASYLEADDIVIPMVPFHLAATYVAVGAGRKKVALPQGLEEQVPHPYPLDAWNLFCSRADFVCRTIA